MGRDGDFGVNFLNALKFLNRSGGVGEEVDGPRLILGMVV